MKTWRSWPWTIALAVVLAGFVLFSLMGLGLRTSLGEVLISLLVLAAAMAGLLRVLTMGVRATPSGVIIRDLTRTTRVYWDQVRRVTCEPTDRRGVYVPVLHLSGPRATANAKTAADSRTAANGKAVANGSAVANGKAVGGPAGRATGTGRGKAGGAGNGGAQSIEITVLGSYKQAVAQRRAAEIETARLASTRRTR